MVAGCKAGGGSVQLEGEGKPVLMRLGGALNCSLLKNAGGGVGRTALSESF